MTTIVGYINVLKGRSKKSRGHRAKKWLKPKKVENI